MHACSVKETRSSKNMDDVLDGLFEGELASINEVFQQFEIKDKKTEKRIQTEEEELGRVHLKVSSRWRAG